MARSFPFRPICRSHQLYRRSNDDTHCLTQLARYPEVGHEAEAEASERVHMILVRSGRRPKVNDDLTVSQRSSGCFTAACFKTLVRFLCSRRLKRRQHPLEGRRSVAVPEASHVSPQNETGFHVRRSAHGYAKSESACRNGPSGSRGSSRCQLQVAIQIGESSRSER